MAKQSSTPKIHTKKHVARLERERRQVSMITAVSIALIVISALLVGYGVLYDKYLKLRQPVAEVNGEKIMMGYWQERVQLQRIKLLNDLELYQYYQQFGMDVTQQLQEVQFQLEAPQYLGEQMLNQLIDETLIRQEAKNRGITVTAEEVEDRIQGTFNFFPNGTQTPTVTPTDFDFSYPTLTGEQLTLYPPTSTPTEALTSTPAATSTVDPATSTPTSTPPPATPTFLPQLPTATSTPYTLDGYKEQYSNALTNIKRFKVSEATFRSFYENQMYAEKLLEEIAKDMPQTEEQVLARHILVDDMQQAVAIKQLIRNGSDFAELAKERSKDTGSGAMGGNLDWATKATYVPEFAEAAFSQKIGEVGEPVQTQFGYHIIQVVAREELPLSLDQLEQKRQTTFADWLTKTREDGKTVGSIVTFDVWMQSVPPMPQSLQQQ